jgi:hypothetical protein
LLLQRSFITADQSPRNYLITTRIGLFISSHAAIAKSFLVFICR